LLNALATGESMATVKRLGFLLAGPDEAIDPTAEESGPYVIDWDELETNRLNSGRQGAHHEPVVA